MKARMVSKRGTEVHLVEVSPLVWARERFGEFQQNMLKKVPKNFVMHIGRGYRTMKAGEIPEPRPRPSTKGLILVTKRGTASQILEE